jgi:NADH:ubiquinone oxidoreductase subunit F (NADH-binding)
MTSEPATGHDLGALARLTAGWQSHDGPASIRLHAERYGPLPADSRSWLAAEVTAAGLTGRGGANFPTGRKMQAVTGHRGPAVVVANGMESEPASEKDQALLARAPHLVLDGLELAGDAVGATEAHLCLSRSRPRLADLVFAAADERRRAGHDRIRVQIHELPHHYVASEETALVHWLNGGEAKPTVTPPRPSERGVGRRPTLIDNVETLAHVALIGRYGASWFRQAGSDQSPGTMLVTVTGAVRQPGVYEVEAGIRISRVLALAGAAADSLAVLIGGFFGTWHQIADVARLPLTKEGLSPAGGSPGAGVLFVLPAGGCGLGEAARVLRYLAGQGAQQCGPCIFGLPAIADDLTQLAASRPDGAPLDRLERRLRQISGRGACRHPDGAVRMAASSLVAFAADVHAHARRRPCLSARGGQPTAITRLPVPGQMADGAWR